MDGYAICRKKGIIRTQRLKTELSEQHYQSLLYKSSVNRFIYIYINMCVLRFKKYDRSSDPNIFIAYITLLTSQFLNLLKT
jgi:hypothetical protein